MPRFFVDKIFTIDPINDVADLNTRDQTLMKPVLVMNLEVKDNHEEAAIGGQLALELCQEVCYYFIFLIGSSNSSCLCRFVG